MLTIAWDVDDVLNDLTRTWLERQWLPSHSGRPIAYEDLRSNPPLAAIGATLEEYLGSLDEFRRDRYLAEIAPLPQAREWFERHGERYRHMALTAVPLASAPVSAAWVFRHFGRWIRTFHCVPSERPGAPVPVYDRTKRDFLAWLGKAVVLVDDRPENVASARQAGCRAVLMPRPWNDARRAIAETFQELENLG
jgi:hypothetical protein